MKGEVLILKFKEGLAFLTEEVALDFTQVGISDSSVEFKAPAFWTIRVITYIQEEKRLFVEVFDYQVGETEFPYNQVQLADTLIEIEKVTFKSIDTFGLLKTQNSTKPIKFTLPKYETVYRPETLIHEPIKQEYKEPFSIPIKDISFISGAVVFEKRINRFNQTIKFQILNENIIKEYDAIKNYFANVLKSKRIQVVPKIIIVDDEIISIDATSIEIDKIDKSFIEEVKIEFANSLRKKEPPGDRQLFTKEEYFKTFSQEDFNEQHLFKDENDFFDNLLKNSETKHYKQLRYLSSKHKSDLQKLRFVQKPFSFVFLLTGNANYHIAWETLDTQEATYIWTFTRSLVDIGQAFIQTEKTVNEIIKGGKNEYIRRNEPNFNRVFHDYSDSQNGFKTWKEEIEKVMST